VLKEWAKSTFIPPNKERQSRLSELTDIQRIIENEEVTQEALNREKEAYQNLHSAMRREEEHWRLKSRSLWLRVGDSNTSFFHK
jgi:hypothetical protein